MMVQITLERQRRDKKPVQRESDGRGLAYPWEWAPQETEVIQNSLADYMPRNWKHGRALYLALAQWLASLRWAKSEEEMAVTFIELAVDFEVESGMDLPRRGQKAVGPEDAEDGEEDAGQKGEAHGGAALAGKMRTLLGMLKTLQGTHDGELLPARKKSIGWLRRLGASRSAKQRKKEDEEIQTAQQDARAEAADGPQRREAEQERQARSVREAAIADKATSTEQPSRRKAVKRPASQVAQNVGARAAGSGDEVMQDEGEARSPQPGRTNKTQDQATKRRRGTRPRDPG
ncbi:hypothetical protein DIPPA_09187 [Diplonema papillatum]|nr:hypothetical protein DIPPA_09187 [Diplonema papillatum]